MWNFLGVFLPFLLAVVTTSRNHYTMKADDEHPAYADLPHPAVEEIVEERK